MDRRGIIETKRTAYFDIAKAYLIMLVVIGHVMIVMNPAYDKKLCIALQEFIYSFHMSAFFILHGVLFNKKKWRSISSSVFIRKRLYSLVIPYFFFETLGILCRYLFQGQAIGTGIWNTLTIRCNVGADWFLIAMFMGSLLFLIYVKHPSRIFAYASVIICLIIPMFCSNSQILKIAGRGMLAYSFIMIGNLGKKFFRFSRVKSKAYILGAFLVTAVCALIGLKFGGNDYYECIIKNPAILAIAGCSGTVMILGISKVIQSKWLVVIGQHTLTVMGTHQLVIYALTSRIPGMYGGSVVMMGLLFITIVIFEILTVYICDIKLSFFVGK